MSGSKSAWSRLRIPSFILLGAVVAGLGIWMFVTSLMFMASEPPATNTTNTDAQSAKASDPDRIDCKDTVLFSDKSFGMQFCYPSDWGVATLRDSKMTPEDTGNRETVIFSNNLQVRVGAVSSDWTTSAGRDGVCSDPLNQPLITGSFNSEWHDIIGSGDAVEFALRHLGGSDQGYDAIEEVSNLLQSGVCAKSTKEVNSSRYQYASVSYYRNFDADGSGVTTPSMHIADPLKLFPQHSRDEFVALIKSIRRYE